MKRRLSQDALVLIVLLVLIVVISFIVGRQQSAAGNDLELIPQRTTYSSNVGGLKGMYDALRELGYPVARRLQPIDSAPDAGTLFIIDPEIPLSELEWKVLQKWVEKGNMLVLTSESAPPALPGEPPETILSVPAYPSFLSPDVGALRVTKGAEVSEDRWDFEKSDSEQPMMRIKIKAKKAPSAETGLPLATLFRNKFGTTVAFARCGLGSVIILCDAWPLTNEGIKLDDNFIVVLNALNHRDVSRKLPVTFDEFHHGYSEEQRMFSLLDTPARLGLLQVCLAFLVVIFAASRGFGRPIKLSEGGRQRSEYLSSMSALLRRAHASGAIAQELDQKFVSDIASLLGLPPSASSETVLQAAALRYPDKIQALRELINAPAKGLDESGILALAVRRNRLFKTLRSK